MASEKQLSSVAETIFVLCRGYGFDILRYPDNLESYLKKEISGANEAVNACTQAVRLPGFTDCLMWCRYYAADPDRKKACEEDFIQNAAAARPDLKSALHRLFAAGTADFAR